MAYFFYIPNYFWRSNPPLQNAFNTKWSMSPTKQQTHATKTITKGISFGSSHNLKVRNQNQNKENPGCNCQKGPEQCSLNGVCQFKSLVYGGKVTKTRTNKSEFYTGITASRFKDRYYEHQSNKRHEDERHKTTMSEWTLLSQLVGHW